MTPVPRLPLTRERVLRAAVALADRDGLDALTMRRLGSQLGVEAMSLYKHVANKGEILDGIIDLVVTEIELPTPGTGWADAMRARATSARKVLLQHPWAVGLLESRGPAVPTVLRNVDATIASLRAGGFGVEAAGHAFWILDSFVYGHVIQELSLSFDASKHSAEDAEARIASQKEDYPHLNEVAAFQRSTSAFDYDNEFDFGLDLVLGALETLRIEG